MLGLVKNEDVRLWAGRMILALENMLEFWEHTKGLKKYFIGQN
jgi:hypothetical protein